MNLSGRIFATCAAGILCGCGTFSSAITEFYYQPSLDPPLDYRTPNFVYGGVKVDAQRIRVCFSEEDVPLPSRFLAPLWIADLPLSAVFDTLSLPRTIRETDELAEWLQETRRKQQASSEDDDPDGDQPAQVPHDTTELD